MARPKVPLISRREAVEAALRVIDAEGLEEFSIRRLGRELGVNGASLYHHFKDKDEILNEVVRLVLSGLDVPARKETWQEWFIEAAQAYRSALLAHPNVAPLLLDRRPRMFGHRVIDYTAQQLADGGVPDGMRLVVMDASEMLAFASALFASRESSAGGFGEIEPEYVHLRRAVKANRFDADQAFEVMCRAIVAGFTAAIEWRALPSRPKRTTRPARSAKPKAAGSADVEPA